MTGVPRPCATELVENGRVLVLALDNPPDNAVTPLMLESLAEGLDTLAAESGPDLAVLTGRGSVFSKGFDVDVVRSHRDEDAHRASLAMCNDVVNRLEESHKPVIAAINGHCFGAGLELAMACHLRLCADKTRLGLPELSRGLLPGLGGVPRLAALVGKAKTLELVALADLIPADEAHRIGLVNRVLPRNDFMAGVLGFARAMLAVDPLLVREVIRLSFPDSPRDRQAEVLAAIDRAVRVANPR
jgi:enoyl-CoA hydratase/carnithine racemase